MNDIVDFGVGVVDNDTNGNDTNGNRCDGDVATCRICKETTIASNNLILQPCNCTGSIADIHEACLSEWVNRTGKWSCEICGSDFRRQVINNGPVNLRLVALLGKAGLYVYSVFEFFIFVLILGELCVINFAALIMYLFASEPSIYKLAIWYFVCGVCNVIGREPVLFGHYFGRFVTVAGVYNRCAPIGYLLLSIAYYYIYASTMYITPLVYLLVTGTHCALMGCGMVLLSYKQKYVTVKFQNNKNS